MESINYYTLHPASEQYPIQAKVKLEGVSHYLSHPILSTQLDLIYPCYWVTQQKNSFIICPKIDKVRFTLCELHKLLNKPIYKFLDSLQLVLEEISRGGHTAYLMGDLSIDVIMYTAEMFLSVMILLRNVSSDLVACTLYQSDPTHMFAFMWILSFGTTFYQIIALYVEMLLYTIVLC